MIAKGFENRLCTFWAMGLKQNRGIFEVSVFLKQLVFTCQMIACKFIPDSFQSFGATVDFQTDQL